MEDCCDLSQLILRSIFAFSSEIAFLFSLSSFFNDALIVTTLSSSNIFNPYCGNIWSCAEQALHTILRGYQSIYPTLMVRLPSKFNFAAHAKRLSWRWTKYKSSSSRSQWVASSSSASICFSLMSRAYKCLLKSVPVPILEELIPTHPRDVSKLRSFSRLLCLQIWWCAIYYNRCIRCGRSTVYVSRSCTTRFVFQLREVNENFKLQHGSFETF